MKQMSQDSDVRGETEPASKRKNTIDDFSEELKIERKIYHTYIAGKNSPCIYTPLRFVK